MTVYVDKPLWRYGRYHMCHMLCNNVEELHAMADKIGIKRKWFQISRQGIPHYDICKSKRTLALKYGAVEVDKTTMLELIFFWRAYNDNGE